MKEVERVKEFLCRIAFPNEHECKETVSNKFLEDCPVTVEAMKNSEKTFGKDVHEIKAKTTRIKPHKVTTMWHDLTTEIVNKCEDVIIAAERFVANRMPM